MITFRSAAAILATLATTALATPTGPMAPVAGGLSDRLAPLGSFIETQPTDFRASMAGQLEQSRTQTHELIDRIIDEGGLAEFLEAMSGDDDATTSEFARQLASADPEQVRSVLHSKVERRLAEFGRTIQSGLTTEDPTRLKASFDLAMADLTREENELMMTLEDEDGPAAPVASELAINHEDLDEPPTTEAEGPAAPQGMGPAAPDGRHGRDRGFQGGGRHGGGHGGPGGYGAPVRQAQRQVRQTQRQVAQTQHQLAQTQRQLARTQRQVAQNQMAMQMRRNQNVMHRQQQAFLARQRAADRARRQAQRSAWLSTQARASAWNARAMGYPTYGYRPGYQQRYSRPFPTGYYYRPDRVERVVRRGLWGVATVAATPFALLASLF